jgi:allophanate hydrolase
VNIAVVGAHLSGLPLNYQLIDRGGTLVCTAQTAACYRLYALPGTVPPKPGMIRVPEGTGGKIEVEIYNLHPAAWAAFVNAIPAPLLIGTILLSRISSNDVALNTMTQVKGFLVEPIAVADAIDITHFGGWRAYIQSQS